MKRAWKIVGGIAAAVIIVVAAFLYWTTWQGSSKEIEAVADQFKPDASWQQVTNQVVPPGTVCLEGNCPSVHRRWKTGANLSKDDFQRILDNSAWKFDIEGDCLPRSNITASGGQSLCSATGVQDGYSIQLVVAGNYEDASSGSVTLFVDR